MNPRLAFSTLTVTAAVVLGAGVVPSSAAAEPVAPSPSAAPHSTPSPPPLTADVTFETDFTVAPTIHGTAVPGATIIVVPATDSDRAVTTTAGANGAWSTELPVLGEAGVVSYAVHETDGDSVSRTVTVDADFGAGVVVSAPSNGTSHTGGRLEFTGTGEPGARVTIVRGNTLLGAAVVGAGGAWTRALTIPGQDATYTVRQVGKGSSVTTQDVTIVAGAVTAPLVITAPAAGGTVVSPSGRVTLRGTGQSGAAISARIDGSELGSRTVAQNGTWELTVALGAGVQDLELEYTPNGQTPRTQTHSFRVLGPIEVTTPAAGTTVDGSSITYAGAGTAGATIEVRGKSGRLLATTRVAADGGWSVDSGVTLLPQDYTVDAIQRATDGSRTLTEVTFTVRPAAVAKAVTFTGPAANSTVHTSTPTFSGQGEPGAKVAVKGSVRTVGETTVTADGTWTVTSAVALDNGSYALSAVQTPANGAAQSTATNPFTIAHEAAANLVVETPTAGATVAGPRPTFTGRGDAGATITIAGTTRTVATAVVQNDGTWAATSTIDLVRAVYDLTVVQHASNGDVERATVRLTVG